MNVIDMLVAVPENVTYGKKTECEKIIVQGGAPAGNAACGLSSLGHETAFLAKLGDNTLSSIARKELIKHGVKDDFIVFSKDASPAISVVQVDHKGERTVLYSTHGYEQYTPKDVKNEMFDDCKMILVDGYDTDINIFLLKQAKKRNIESVLDMEKVDLNIMKEMLSLTSNAILPLEAAQFLSGFVDIKDCVRSVSKMTKAQVIVTDGVAGSFTLIDDEVYHQASYKVDVVDTTGCGDAFHAAYASALVQGFNIKQRMNYASFFAAQVARVFGGRSSFPSRKFMEDNLGLK